jgi:hypothetical protein
MEELVLVKESWADILVSIVIQMRAMATAF